MNEITIVAPRSIEESEKLSALLAKSNLLPEAIRGKAADILTTLLAGAELGLAPMQALRGIHIIKGKPSLSADLMGALVKRNSDVCEYLQLAESTPKRAVYRTKRRGEPEPTTMVFTIEDAQSAGIASDMYRKHPAAMLRARCLAAICRAVYPDLCLGLYDSDSGELTDGAPVEKEINAPPAQQVVQPTPTVSRTEALRAKVEAQMKPAETQQAEPSIYDQMCAAFTEYGRDIKALGPMIKEVCPGKSSKKDLTQEDLATVRKHLASAAEAQKLVQAHLNGAAPVEEEAPF